MANIKSVKIALYFFATVSAQFALSQYATYIAFSWDIVEPITACVALSDAIAGYFFWLWSKKPWDVNEIRSHFFEKKLQKLMKK